STRLAAWCAVTGARGAHQPVRIADRCDGDARSALGRPGRAIADGLTLRDPADLQDAPAQLDDALHRVGPARCRIDAVERGPGPRQIAQRRIAEENAGGIGQRSGNAAVEAAQIA